MHGAEKSEKPPLLLTKTENQRLNWRRRKPSGTTQDTKTEKPQFLSAKTGNSPNQKLAKSAKPKIPTLPPLPAESLDDRKNFFLYSELVTN